MYKVEVSIWRRSLPLQRPDIPHHKHQNPSEGVGDAIDREFNGLFDQWRKPTSEILSEPTERYEIGESVLLGKAIPYPVQVNSVKGVYHKNIGWVPKIIWCYPAGLYSKQEKQHVFHDYKLFGK